MSDPIRPAPPPALSKLGLLRRLVTAPFDHAEALLNGLDVLEKAQKEGVFDALRSALGAQGAITELARFASDPQAANALGNLLALSRVIGSLDADSLSKLSNEVAEAVEAHRTQEPPSLWQLLKRIQQPEARRGLALLTSILAALGRATK